MTTISIIDSQYEKWIQLIFMPHQVNVINNYEQTWSINDDLVIDITKLDKFYHRYALHSKQLTDIELIQGYSYCFNNPSKILSVVIGELIDVLIADYLTDKLTWIDLKDGNFHYSEGKLTRGDNSKIARLPITPGGLMVWNPRKIRFE